MILRFDGSASPNPGPAGCGYIIVEKSSGDIIRCAGAALGCQTNNVAEYTGLILGCEEALTMGISSIEIEGDSLLVVSHILGSWQCKAANLLPLLERAKAILSRFERYTIKWIPRKENAEADRLADSFSAESARMREGRVSISPSSFDPTLHC